MKAGPPLVALCPFCSLLLDLREQPPDLPPEVEDPRRLVAAEWTNRRHAALCVQLVLEHLYADKEVLVEQLSAQLTCEGSSKCEGRFRDILGWDARAFGLAAHRMNVVCRLRGRAWEGQEVLVGGTHMIHPMADDACQGPQSQARPRCLPCA